MLRRDQLQPPLQRHGWFGVFRNGTRTVTYGSRELLMRRPVASKFVYIVHITYGANSEIHRHAKA